MKCCGYADCNDAARLAHDPIHKLVLGRDPIHGVGLASQPTLSRFENAVEPRELLAMGHVLADTVIDLHRQRLQGHARRITIDLDPTDLDRIPSCSRLPSTPALPRLARMGCCPR
jgi:hypothetical protein